MDDEMKKFFEKCKSEAPIDHNFEYDTESNADGEYALVREISEDDDNMYVQILVSGDLDGVSWMYDRACEFFPEFKGGIMKTDDYYRFGEKVDFH